ncbi:MAG: multicopper oxidase domain-containing protein [Ilumatobacter sp.]|nr:multicopper oxidase domain-containing protein [Ilumatobacter sp.]
MTITDAPPAGPSDSPPSGSAGDSPLGNLAVIAISAIVVSIVAILGAIAVTALIAGGGSSEDAVTTSQLNVTLSEFAIDGELTAPAGQVVLNISNEGSLDHNVVVRGSNLRSQMLAAGGSTVLDLGELAPGTYELFCEVAGHEASGMVHDLVITEGGSAADDAAAPTAGDGGHEGMDAEAMDLRMVESMLAFPAETEGSGNQLLEFEVDADGTKIFELTAAVTQWERSPGEFVDAWSYNGIVPGPQIKVDVGDNVRVILHNETPMGTDIHWHGIKTPNDQDGVSPITQDPVSSGETYVYEFVADQPAIGMYHAHLHSQVSVPNGMFGSFVIGENPYPYGQTISGVEIPMDLEPVVDMPMVINDAGVIGLTLNGKSFPATEPLVLEQGDWAAVHYYNEGLTDHPMHLHQMPQLVYAKDGIPLDHPYWADTINVAPGERYSVLFEAKDLGTWVWHCHILTHVEREEGMFGMVTAVVVTEAGS